MPGTGIFNEYVPSSSEVATYDCPKTVINTLYTGRLVMLSSIVPFAWVGDVGAFTIILLFL